LAAEIDAAVPESANWFAPASEPEFDEDVADISDGSESPSIGRIPFRKPNVISEDN
jgi:hypothetical protein